MSPSIWTRCAARANLRRLGGKAWRVVEAQHVVSTRKLVDSAAEHDLLERLIEGAKPPQPGGPEFEGLHYLLGTPFRYPPLRHGSRFATRNERSVWYGSSRPRTAFAEAAYYRLLFLEGTTADLEPVTTELSLFHAKLGSYRGADLTRPPFDAHRATIASPSCYEETQRMGHDMRNDGVAVFRYPSARDLRGGTNIGLLSPEAFASRQPSVPETWACVTTRARVAFVKRDFFERRSIGFPREDFLVDGQLPAPAP